MFLLRVHAALGEAVLDSLHTQLKLVWIVDASKRSLSADAIGLQEGVDGLVKCLRAVDRGAPNDVVLDLAQPGRVGDAF